MESLEVRIWILLYSSDLRLRGPWLSMAMKMGKTSHSRCNSSHQAQEVITLEKWLGMSERFRWRMGQGIMYLVEYTVVFSFSGYMHNVEVITQTLPHHIAYTCRSAMVATRPCGGAVASSVHRVMSHRPKESWNSPVVVMPIRCYPDPIAAKYAMILVW